jgi:hypothetical protein
MSCCLFLLLWTAAQFAQSNTGELRLTVTDPSGLPIQGAVELVSEANQLRQNLETDPQGATALRHFRGSSKSARPFPPTTTSP